MLIELRVIGDNEAAIAADVAKLAEDFGVVAQDIVFERPSEHTIVGVALGER
jgi:hypothetical protein